MRNVIGIIFFSITVITGCETTQLVVIDDTSMPSNFNCGGKNYRYIDGINIPRQIERGVYSVKPSNRLGGNGIVLDVEHIKKSDNSCKVEWNEVSREAIFNASTTKSYSIGDYRLQLLKVGADLAHLGLESQQIQLILDTLAKLTPINLENTYHLVYGLGTVKNSGTTHIDLVSGMRLCGSVAVFEPFQVKKWMSSGSRCLVVSQHGFGGFPRLVRELNGPGGQNDYIAVDEYDLMAKGTRKFWRLITPQEISTDSINDITFGHQFVGSNQLCANQFISPFTDQPTFNTNESNFNNTSNWDNWCGSNNLSNDFQPIAFFTEERSMLAPEVMIQVNGTQQWVQIGTTILDVLNQYGVFSIENIIKDIKLKRMLGDELVPVIPKDNSIRNVPLLMGDSISW